MGGAHTLGLDQQPPIRGSPQSVSSPGSCPEAQAAGEQGGVCWVSQGPQQRGGRRCAGTQSKTHSDRRPGLQVSQGTKEAVLVQLEATLVLLLQGPASSVSPREGQSQRVQGGGTMGYI